MNQLPIPARGARTTRLGIVRPPSSQLSVSAFGIALDAIALVQQSQPGEREEVVDLVDRLGERSDDRRVPAGGDRVGLLPHLGPQAAHDRVDRPRVAVDDAGTDRVDRRLADELARRPDVDLGQLGGALGQRVHRDLDARRDDAAQVLALRADRVVGDRGAEVHDHDRVADLVVGGDRVDEPVRADLAGVVVAQRHPGLHAGADHEHLVAQIARGHVPPLGPELGHRRGDDRRADVREAHAAQLEQRGEPRAELVGRRLADRGEAPVLEQLGPLEGPEVGLGVADVDDEEHAPAKYRRAGRATFLRRRRQDAAMTSGEPTLYVVPASHPCAAVMLAFERKGLAYRRVDLPPMVHVAVQRVMFGRRTVPGLKLPSGDKIVGSRAIMRVLDGLEPDPPLLPAGAALRAKVEAAEAWGDEVLQPLVRRVLWAGFQARPDAWDSSAAGADLPIPAPVAAASGPLLARLERLLNRSTDGAVRSDLAALDAHLDRADGYVT